MAVQKNTNDLLSQAATNLPNNTTQQISPQDIREMAENLAVSSFNKITDSALVGLKSYNTLVTYESGQACISGSDIYISNQITGPGAFNAAHWTLFKSGSGTQNKLAKFGANGAVTDSSITDNGTNYLFSLLNTNGFVKTNGGTGQLSVSSQVSATEGGTGKSSWVAGSIPYISATNTFGEVTAAGNDGKFLSLVAGVPTWATVSAPNLGTINLTSTDNNRTFSLNGNTAGSSFAFLTLAGLEILKVKGDLSVSTYNNGGYIVNKFLNKGAIIGGNYNGSTTSDPNNVLGGSYANGVIIGGYNNTHNGFLGLIGGGADNTIAANKSQCIALGGANNITGDYAMALSTLATVSGNFAAAIGGFQNTASGEGAVAIGGNQAIASGYRSFAQGYGSYASAHYSVTFGSYSAASARSARAVGEYCVASGVSSWVSGLGVNYGGTGQELKASGAVSFNHSYNDGLVFLRAAEGDYSVILGGKNHWTKSGSTSSAILGGEGNTINASVLRSVILGGSGITATANDTVYTPNLNVSGDAIFSQSTNSTATGANARITSHPTSTIVLTNASLTSIGSIVAGLAGGHIVTLINETGASITIVDAYGSAAAGEVIYTNTASNLTIRNNCGATFQYNATGACWTKI